MSGWVRDGGTLPFALPDIDEADIAAVVEVLRSRWITTGPRTRQFEQEFAGRLGVRHAIAVNSATAALHLALDAIGLREGDEVILPTLTFTACAEVVRYFNASPVLVDVEPDTLCIDPEMVRQAITSRTRAIMPVHFAGHAARMDELLTIAAASDLAVVEDAAHAFPCTYKGRFIGNLGDLTCFSFYSTKTITTAEGGMLLTNDDEYAERARLMSLHGMSRDAWQRYAAQGAWRYDVIAPGFKYNMTDMAAALGLTQLAKATAMWRRRASIAERYSRAFQTLPELRVPAVLDWTSHAWHLYVLRLDLAALTMGRDSFMQEMQRRGIKCSVHFIPLHLFTYYRTTYGYTEEDFPVANDAFCRMLSLPLYSAMSDRDVEDVIAAAVDVVTTFRRAT